MLHFLVIDIYVWVERILLFL